MSDKDTAIAAVQELPNDSSFEDIVEHLAVLAAIRRGEQAADAGQVIPHEEVRQRMAEWISK